MKSIQDEILLVIPYINGGQGNELELALTGWRKYCKSPLRIVVIGDYNPCIDSKAEYIEYSRTQALKNQYVPNIDVARKLNKIYDLFHEEYDHFVLANDDEYPIKDFDYHFLTQVTFLQDKFMGNASAPTNYWSHDMYKTRQLLDKEKKPHVNYCNHHPFYFDMERFHEMSMKFNLANNSAIRENLYYNYYDFKTVVNVNSIRTGIWDTIDTKKKVQAAIDNPNIKFICNSVAGWSKELMEMIGNYYGVGTIENKVTSSNSKYLEGVSICISAWKAQDYIEECLDSVANQTWFKDHDNWEILLGIDGCEETLAKVKEIMHKYKNLKVMMMKENVGTYVTCNTIMKEARYEWLLRFDSDDIMNPELVQTVLDNSKDADMILWKMKNFGNISNGIDIQKSYGQHLIKHSVFDTVNGYKNWVCGADDDLIHRLSNFYKVKILNTVLMKRRLHSLSLTVQDKTNFNSDIRKKYIEIVTNPNSYSTKEKCINLEYSISKFRYIPKDKIIVTFTSWKKRIHLCAHTVDLMLNQTIKPDKIILNLSEEEFQRKEEELPKELVEKQNNIFEIYWVKENTKAFKKVIPTLKRYPNDIIISIDDDIEYPKNSIESLYDTYLKSERNNPISAGTWDWEGGIHSHLGALSLFKKEMFGDYLNDLYTNIVLKYGIDEIPFDDALYTYSALLNKRRYIQSKEVTGIDLINKSPEHQKNRLLHQLNKPYNNALKNEHKILKDYIQLTYKVNYQNMIDNSTERYYSSFGKKYNGEKAIISLTSWKARINTVYKTIDSLLNQCPGFHIVLVLSIEEFPNMINELPKSLKDYINNDKIEILWVYKNYKVFKKVLFSIDKYHNIPVISADDDCIYNCNYAEKLYKKWSENKNCVITNNGNKRNDLYWSQGPNTLFPPNCDIIKFIPKLNQEIIEIGSDDSLYAILYKKYNIKMIELKEKNYFNFHDEINPLLEIRKKSGGFYKLLEKYNKTIK